MQNSEENPDILHRGLSFLKEDMEAYPSFDPNAGYEEKNMYFVRANSLGLALMRQGLYILSEHYYSNCCSEIVKFEKDTGKKFNKGMAYANLGISEMYNYKLSLGIAHLLAAEIEDQPVNHPDYDILNETLWEQFEDNFIFPFLYQFDGNTEFEVNKSFLSGFFRRIDRQDRIFIESTVWALKIEIESYQKTGPNVYTWGRLYSILKDLCLITESMLRKKQIKDGLVRPGQRIELQALLTNALKREGLPYPQRDVKNSANDLREFLDNLEIFLNITDEKIKRIHYLNLIRNFTGHHFDIQDTITSSAGNQFFDDLYPMALQHVLTAIMYLEYIKAL